MRQLTISVGGMSCEHCVGRVSKALAALPGVRVEHVEVGSASVTYEPAVISPERLAQTVEDLGYTAETPQTA
jgi:copper chaperone CopZ